MKFQLLKFRLNKLKHVVMYESSMIEIINLEISSTVVIFKNSNFDSGKIKFQIPNSELANSNSQFQKSKL